PFADHLWPLLLPPTPQGPPLAGAPDAPAAPRAEETHPTTAPRAPARYSPGNPWAATAGRPLPGLATALGGWQWGVAANTLLGLLALTVFVLLLPRSHGPRARPDADTPGDAGMAKRLRAAITTRGLPALYAQAFLLMGAFMAVYN